MQLEVEHIIEQPASIVYPLVRDEMQKIIPYMPDIENIKTLQSEAREDGRLEVVNHWFSKPANVPGPLKKVAKPELFSWKDFALWNDDKYCVDYRLESMIANDLFTASGTNYFEPHGDNQTRVLITCSLEVYPEKMPGVPRFLAKSLRPMIESTIRKVIEPNLSSLAQGLTAYFSDPNNTPTAD
jgi:hypothetical protein